MHIQIRTKTSSLAKTQHFESATPNASYLKPQVWNAKEKQGTSTSSSANLLQTRFPFPRKLLIWHELTEKLLLVLPLPEFNTLDQIIKILR